MIIRDNKQRKKPSIKEEWQQYVPIGAGILFLLFVLCYFLFFHTFTRRTPQLLWTSSYESSMQTDDYTIWLEKEELDIDEASLVLHIQNHSDEDIQLFEKRFTFHDEQEQVIGIPKQVGEDEFIRLPVPMNETIEPGEEVSFDLDIKDWVFEPNAKHSLYLSMNHGEDGSFEDAELVFHVDGGIEYPEWMHTIRNWIRDQYYRVRRFGGHVLRRLGLRESTTHHLTSNDG